MGFEFDPDKRLAGERRHAIDFVEAQALWNDPVLPEIPARTDDEPRPVVIGNMDGNIDGKIDGKIETRHGSGVIPYRIKRMPVKSGHWAIPGSDQPPLGQ